MEIIEMIKGETKGHTLKIHGDDGMSCRHYAGTFQKDKYYIIIISKEYSGGADYNNPANYFNEVSSCGQFFVEYNPGDRFLKYQILVKGKKPHYKKKAISFKKYKEELVQAEKNAIKDEEDDDE